MRARLRERLGLGPEQDRVLRDFAADHLRGRARRARRPGRGAPGVERVARDDLRGLRDATLSEASLLELVARAEASPTRRLRRGGRTWVAELEHAGRRYVVKGCDAGSFAERCVARLRGTRAARAFAKGRRDQLLLGRAARPLAALDAERGGLPGACWLVLEAVAGVDLDRHRPASTERALALANALGEWLAELHALGLGHADLKGSNLRVEEVGETFRFRLLDLEDLVGPARPTDEARLVALAQLNASIADEDLSCAAREAFLARYLARLPFDDPKLDQAGARREIARRSLARRHRFRGIGCEGVEPGLSPPSP
ncbi:MAG: lipopolysaccharide kinase InaA family protein [Myxococcota bacterium]